MFLHKTQSVLIAAAGAALLTIASPQYARADVSEGCAALAALDWDFDSVTAGSITIPRGPFAVGDVIELTVSGTSGTARVMDPPFTTAVISINVAPTAATQTYTVDTEGTYALSVLSPVGFTASARCVPPAPEAEYDGAVIQSFLLARMNGLLLNSPGAMSLVNRDGGQALTTAIGPNGFQFSTSLSGVRRQAERVQGLMAYAPDDGTTLPAAYDSASPWDVWVEGRYSGFSNDDGDLDRDGSFGLLSVGGDYRVTQNMIVGVMGQFDWAKETSGALASSVEGTGWMAGPYMSMQLHNNVFFDLRAAWGRSHNNLTIDATTGSFDTSRWLVKGTLAGNWVRDAWRFTPSAELSYVRENQDGYTNSDDVFIDGQTVSLGRLQFGPEIGYRIAQTSDTFIEPFAALKGVWNWDNPNIVVDSAVIGSGALWARLEGGINVTTAGGLRLRGLASWDGLGADGYSGYTLQGTVSVPLN